jgi:hypothetical protein
VIPVVDLHQLLLLWGTGKKMRNGRAHNPLNTLVEHLDSALHLGARVA